ncbi:hypothetical protein ACLKMH_24490 [Psychromonas sp. KJ10-10]
MEYGYGLMTAWSLNKINFDEVQKEWDKPSLTSTLFSKLTKKAKKSK